MSYHTLVMDEDGGDVRSGCIEGLAKEYQNNAQANLHMKNKKGGKEVVCSNCLGGGVLLCCSGKGCQKRYHPSCVDPPLKYIPLRFWHCIWCTKKKIEFGVHSVSEGVKSILDSREVVSNNKVSSMLLVMQREYFVKYQGLAHAHNRWITESTMLLEAPKLLAKFKSKPQVSWWKRDWSIPHRLLLKREIVHFGGHGDNDSICCYEWLVKWTGLGYDNATWELQDASFLTSAKGRKLIRDYESRRKGVDKLSKRHFEDNEETKTFIVELSVLPFGDSPGLYNQYLSYVNKLRMCWYKGQNALIVDDQIDQERIIKVILFVLSLNCNSKRPFLIISTSTALSVWEAEFLHLAPSANLVVYKGNRDVRSGIRALEFYSEENGILFQILLSSSDIVVEDLHELRCIPWKAIIIDECQQSRISGHLDHIKTLNTEMKLLLVSGQIKEDRYDYIKLLSFLKSAHHGPSIARMETSFSASISNLKSQLEKYVVFKCKSGSTRFVEYWVPACLSHLQLEQYCSMLLSNLILLCSGQKSDTLGALHELIISTRKCCDHPYLLEPALHNSVAKGLPVEEHLDIGIKASGKLLLLEKILLEAKSRGLRVLILFQSSCGSGSIGDILDDVLCQRFGIDCYVRYDRAYTPKTKEAALDTFNDRDSGKFVFLMENRACLPSVKLSSVDIVILFDSDFDPQNDLRGLQRMSISTQLKQLTVFRLYSYYTVEEKILMLAKEGISLDSNVRLISHSISHTLLKWGTSHLFNKLDDLHASVTAVSTPDIADQTLLHDVLCELSSQLVCDADDIDCHELSFISTIQQNGGEYSRNILLLGERIMKELGSEPSAFSWSDLEAKYPQWKFLSVSSQRMRSRVKHSDYIINESECEGHTIMGKRTASNASKKSKVSKDNFDHNLRKLAKDKVEPERRKVSKDIVETEGMEPSNHAIDPKTRKVFNGIVKSGGRKMSKKIRDSKYRKSRLRNKKNSSVSNSTSKSNGTNGLSSLLDSSGHPLANETTGETTTNIQLSEKRKLLDGPNSIKFLPKSDISGLCEILHFPLDSDDANAVTSIGSAVPEARQWGSIMSPVCDESTGPKFAETTFPNTQPSDANLWSLPLMAMSDIPSFPEHNSASAVTPLDDIFNHSREDHCYIHEAEVILEAPNNTVEPVNSSFGSPVILKPFTSVPMNENMTHVPDSFTIPGYMNSDSIQHHYVASEISDDVYLDSLLDEMEITENTNEEAFIDPLLIAMERIEKDKEEAFKIHEKKILQLRSEYELEVEKLSEKYRILLQNVDTEVALKKMEFETQCKLVSSSEELAEIWIHMLDDCEMAVG
ncbi:uncharacterized protein LOC108322436 isoform X6 [Vigna angularis]|uniref:uncharacterized protein LOC108322436 isoform X6 n=1 Tax=Phaseolus angularis TaxID=3914 RepID=UPI00080A623D|nr:uncharacterized protein LOC108322436 isoform X6 [Vigna angularis]